MREGDAPSIAQALANLDWWLETMRQRGGYGGPIAHWWQSCYLYAGPGLDWRYEGILWGYRTLYEKTRNERWRQKLRIAAADLIWGQERDGAYRASQFEQNPGILGTPHEAAATLGLLAAVPYVEDPSQALATCQANADNLIDKLWDNKARGFNDRPGVRSRVPNKLATLAEALMALYQVSGEPDYLELAEAALSDVVRYQIAGGPFDGAIHQYAAKGRGGDGRLFPYYNARCVAGLLMGAKVLAKPAYAKAASRIIDFLERTKRADGSWPQVVYRSGAQAHFPGWIAGRADIIRSYRLVDRWAGEKAWQGLLAGQMGSGGFRTAVGFQNQIDQKTPEAVPDFRDVTPVVGWNDKVFRLLADMLPEGETIPDPTTDSIACRVLVGGRPALFRESAEAMVIEEESERYLLYRWNKKEPWAFGVATVAIR